MIIVVCMVRQGVVIAVRGVARIRVMRMRRVVAV